MGPEVGPAFQRLSREPLNAILSVRLDFAGQTTPRSLAFAPRSEPPHARAMGAQIIRMASG
eukprot:gene16041-biopygen17227